MGRLDKYSSSLVCFVHVYNMLPEKYIQPQPPPPVRTWLGNYTVYSNNQDILSIPKMVPHPCPQTSDPSNAKNTIQIPSEFSGILWIQRHSCQQAWF
jgi:hypothetical protein